MKSLLSLTTALLLTGCTTTVQTKQSQAKLTPAEILTQMQQGNDRFVAGKPLHRNLRKQVQLTASGQHPSAAVLSCIDSRTSSELIFDQGIGDIFNARIAGNVINSDILGSLEFACAAAGSKLILVVGHTACGAVLGATKGVQLEHLSGLLDKIQPAIKSTPKGSADVNYADQVAIANVRHSVSQIRNQSQTLRALERSGKISIAGALYHVETGRVELLK